MQTNLAKMMQKKTNKSWCRKTEDKKKKKTSGNSGEKEAEISKIGEGTIKVDDYEGSSEKIGQKAKNSVLKLKNQFQLPFGGDNVQMSGSE